MVEFIQQALTNPMIMYPLLIWSIFWKGLALWRSARMNHKGWFIALLVINTVGIFEIIYLVATRDRYHFLEGIR
ncbi:MAG: hypothetical protein KBG91_06640 [Syntrophomonadaceae bacterium]|jgi:uncharacterized membrane protein YiaA|nr:hypothetical protein [Syntrophomonadaceae bacterium]NLX01564.1 hypothetical protein [Syntrophomonadaceae bacterium]